MYQTKIHREEVVCPAARSWQLVEMALQPTVSLTPKCPVICNILNQTWLDRFFDLLLQELR